MRRWSLVALILVGLMASACAPFRAAPDVRAAGDTDVAFAATAGRTALAVRSPGRGLARIGPNAYTVSVGRAVRRYGRDAVRVHYRNVGQRGLSYGLGVTVEVRQRGRWRSVRQGAVEDIGLGLRRGERSRSLFAFLADRHERSRRYRVTASTSPSSRGGGAYGNDRFETYAYFTVSPRR